jgi:AraC-like DNA-binding protein
MPPGASGGGLQSFSIDGFPERERSSALREFLGRKLSRVECEPLSDELQFDVTARCVGGIHLVAVNHSLMNLSRTRELLADGDDSLILSIGGSVCRGSQFGRDFVWEPGDAGLLYNGDLITVTCGGKTLLLKLAYQQLRPLLADFDSAVTRSAQADTSAVRFLRSYIGLFGELPAATPELQHCFVTHVYDLVATALGATREIAEQARGRGVRAARLHAVKSDILAHLADHTLSISTVAARQGISPVYIRKLFEDEALSFSTFVLENRLAAVRRMLSDARFRDQTIGAIAFDAGFGDLSYFNRAFRRRFGASPSDIRAEANRLWAEDDKF